MTRSSSSGWTEAYPLIVLGRIGAGKTTFADIAMEMDDRLTLIEGSSIVRSMMPESQETMYEFARRLREERGPAVFAQAMIERYAIGNGSSYVISGLRTIQELALIKDHAPMATVVFIESRAVVRAKRRIGRADRPIRSMEELRMADRRDDAFGLLPIARGLADIVLSNSSGRRAFQEAIQRLFARCLRRIARSRSLGVAVVAVARALERAGRPLRAEHLLRAVDRASCTARMGRTALASALSSGIIQPAEGSRYSLTPTGRAYITYMTAHVPSAIRASRGTPGKQRPRTR